jgi:hypothetical protein
VPTTEFDGGITDITAYKCGEIYQWQLAGAMPDSSPIFLEEFWTRIDKTIHRLRVIQLDTIKLL